MRPPFTYYGGKVGLAWKLIELMPPHRVYIEPFFGSGAVFFAKHPVTQEIINDTDRGIVTFFRMLRERPVELERVCRLTPYARDEFKAALDNVVVADDLEAARRFWVRVNQSFAKTAGAKTGWSITTARTQSPPRSVQGRLDRFHRCAKRLADAQIENCDGVDLIVRFATADTVIYADPPYLAATRVGRADGRKQSDYRHEMTDAEHRRLAETLNATTAAVVLSGYPSDLYDELYAGWWSADFEVVAHSSNSRRHSRKGRTERVWLNREPAHQLWSNDPIAAVPNG